MSLVFGGVNVSCFFGLFCGGFAAACCGYCLKASMTGGTLWVVAPSPLPLWIADQVRNDVAVLSSMYLAWRFPALWIDESLITLCQRVRL